METKLYSMQHMYLKMCQLVMNTESIMDKNDFDNFNETLETNV